MKKRTVANVLLVWLAATACLAEPGALRLVFFTDVHTRTEWDTPKALEKAAAAINAENPDLVIGGGDYITDGFQSGAEAVEPRWQAYFSNLQGRVRAPVFPVPGNHDLVGAMPEDGTPPAADPRAVFRAKFGLEKAYGSFDTNGYHFILLDSIKITEGGKHKYEGHITSAQMEWLKEDLFHTPTGTPIVVVTHFPLLTVFYQATEGATASAPKNRIVTNAKDVLDLFAGRRLALVLQGHLHVNEMIRWKGTTFLTGGAVCAQWWRGPWYGTEEGFVVVDLRSGQVDWRYVDYGWNAERPEGQ